MIRPLGRTFALALATVLLVSAPAVMAQTLTSTRTGYTTAGGGGSSGPMFAGSAGQEYRGNMSFSVPTSATPYTSATLRLNANQVDAGPNDIAVYDMTADPFTATNAVIFTDSGDGTVLGTASGLVTNQAFDVVLNAAGLAAVNAAQGSTVTFGVVNTTITPGYDFVFNAASEPRELIHSSRLARWLAANSARSSSASSARIRSYELLAKAFELSPS